MEIIFKYPLYLFALVVLAAAAITALLYYKNKRDELSPLARYLLSFLRFVVFSISGIYLLSPMIKTKVKEVKKPTIIIAVDNSRSIVANADSIYYNADFKALTGKLQKRLKGKYNPVFYTFDSKIKYNGKLDFSGTSTNISAAVGELNRLYRHKNIGAMILFSDGIYNRGENPVYLARNLKYPVYTVLLGDTALRRDIKIKSLSLNKITFLGDFFPVEAEIFAKKSKGFSTEAVLSVDGKIVDRKPLTINSDFSRNTVKFRVKAVKTGIHKISVSVKALENEFNRSNNVRTAFVEVLNERQKIALIYNAPHPDVAALMRSLKSSGKYEVVSLPFSKVKNLNGYNLAVFHNLPAAPNDFIKMKSLLKKSQIPYLIITGIQTDINSFNRLGAGVMIDARRRSFNKATGLINDNFELFAIGKDFRDLLPDLPPLTVPFGKYRLGANTQAAVNQKIGTVSTSYPLIALRNSAGNRSGVIAGEGLWRWRLYDYSVNNNTDAFDDFTGKVVKILSLKVKKERFVVEHKNIYMQDENIEFVARLYNAVYEPVTAPDVKVLVRNISTGKDFNYTMGKSENKYFLNAGKLDAGTYSFRISTSFDGKSYSKAGTFVVQPLEREFLNLEADRHLLYIMSESTGGKLYDIPSAGKILKDLKKRDDIAGVEYTYLRYRDLIDIYQVLFLIVLLIAVEWFVRKYSGGY